MGTPTSKNRIAALIVAAGRGTRFGGETPKQYVPLNGPCAFRRSLERFLEHPDVAVVQPVIHADDQALFAKAIEGLDHPDLQPPVTGGATRAASVLRGLEALEGAAADCVLVHDAARPFLPAHVITDVVKALETSPAAFAALPVVDALWSSEEGLARASVARDGLWRAQTPQGFHFKTLLAAHRAHPGDAADDVAIVRAQNVPVQIVQGHTSNFKITTPEDLDRALSLVTLEANST